VIALAVAIGADAVILDERKGRAAARSRGLHVSGTIGVLDRAVRAGLVDREDVIERLRTTTFRATPRLLRTIGSTS
jgi:predicted nucleic acid-binding protein